MQVATRAYYMSFVVSPDSSPKVEACPYYIDPSVYSVRSWLCQTPFYAQATVLFDLQSDMFILYGSRDH